MTISRNPVLTAGTIAGIVLAGWNVIVAQGMFDFLTVPAQDSLQTFINLLVPIVAAYVASRFSTSLAAPNLPLGTMINATSDAPTGVVVKA